MTDLATLGIRIDSREVKAANDDLAKLASTTRTTEQATKGFERSAEQASTKSRKLAQDVRGVEAAMGNMRGVIGGMAAALAGAFAGAASLGTFIANTSEAESASVQLAAAIKSTGGAAGLSVNELQSMASALQGVTNFGDEAIMGAQGLLLTFTRVGKDVFPRATQAILDMSQAMGQDLKSSTMQIGKALNEPKQGISALTEAGVQFSKSQKAMIERMVETGNIAGAQAVILKELETQFGGSAKAARDTLGGAITSLKNTFGDLFEVTSPASAGLRASIEGLGSALANPAFAAFVQVLGSLMFGALSLVSQGITALVALLPTLAEYAAVAGAALTVAFAPAIAAGAVSLATAIGGALVSALGALAAAMMANPLIAGASLFAAALVAVYHFRNEISSAIGADVMGIARDVANGLIGLFVGAFQAIVAGVQAIPSAFKTAFALAMNGAVQTVQAGVNSIIGLMNRIPGMNIGGADLSLLKLDEGTGVSDMGRAVSEAFRRAQGDYVGAASQAISGFVTAGRRTFDTPAGGRNKPAAGSSSGGGGATESANAYERELAAIQKKTNELEREGRQIGLNKAILYETEAAQKLYEAAKKAGIPVSGEMASAIEKESLAYAAAKLKVDELTRAQEASRELQQFIGQTVSGFFSDIVSGGKNAEQALSNLIKKLADAALQAALLGSGPLASLFGTQSAEKGGVGGLIGALFGGFKGLFTTNALGGVYGAANDNIIRFAAGGAFTNSIVDSPTLFKFAQGTGLMGEAGPEAIMPLKRGPNGALGVQMHGGGAGGGVSVSLGGITVNMQGGSSGDSEQDGKAVAEVAMREVERMLPAMLYKVQKYGRAA